MTLAEINRMIRAAIEAAQGEGVPLHVIEVNGIPANIWQERPNKPSGRQVSLYRHFDDDGRLLYVGISLNAISRLSDHRTSCWFDRIARVEIERHPSREAALAAELEALRTEKPLHNIVGKVAT